MTELADRLVLGLVAATTWALRFIVNALLARMIVALAVLFVAALVSAYALWIGALLWFVVGRFGIARDSRHRRIAATATCIGAVVGLALMLIRDHHSAWNVGADTILASSGAALWCQRHTAIKALRHGVRRGAS